MTTADRDDVQDIVDLAQSICGVEIAAVGVLDQDEFHYVVTSGVEPQSVPVTATLCQHAMDSPGLLVIPDTLADDRSRTSPFVDGTVMGLRFYASSPIYAPAGEMVGRLCVFDSHEHALTQVQEHALMTLGRSLSSILELRLDGPEDRPVGGGAARDLDIAARISHDLRLPLASLTASLELLADATEPIHDPMVNRLLSTSRRSLTRMSGLVEALLGLYELTRKPVLQPVDLNEVVARVLADTDVLIGAASALIEVADLPVITADPDLMYSALLNLVTNALKFSRPFDAPLVQISAKRLDRKWRIEVTDNGMGVPPDQRDEIFAMFTRLTDAPGHGIGLTTLAQIIAVHAGSLGVEQPDQYPEGVGSTFWFALPDRTTDSAPSLN